MPDLSNLSPSAAGDVAKVDVLLHPSAIRTAPQLDEHKGATSPLDAYVQDVLTVPASLAGLPALNVPCPLSAGENEEGYDGWPIGFSVVGQWGADELVLKVGKLLHTS